MSDITARMIENQYTAEYTLRLVGSQVDAGIGEANSAEEGLLICRAMQACIDAVDDGVSFTKAMDAIYQAGWAIRSYLEEPPSRTPPGSEKGR